MAGKSGAAVTDHRLQELVEFVENVLGTRSLRLLILGLAKSIEQLQQKVDTMGDTLSAQLEASLASVNAALDALSSDVTSIASEVTILVAGMTSGSTITQAQIDQANALAARVQSLDTQAKSIVAQGQPATPVEPLPAA